MSLQKKRKVNRQLQFLQQKKSNAKKSNEVNPKLANFTKLTPSFAYNKQKQEVQFKKFLDVLKQLHINIPLLEALEKMPNSVKFMKDILSKKK
ncbi:Retrovirus-related Pol polyprotein from transposon 17.6 [Gossypium australe]|uniref:Retrovirus-related Pol polyprotein from transposon 17.6 n=1 Tax=Gossypium australe TaxID=47621 RepID=A0A5B6WQV8_9ROSI|nr:Retrovirus-related Pol polyprotein from transposon 17.6 [Gossypium australe]